VTVDAVVDAGKDGQCMALPPGVCIRPLDMHPDERGVFTEAFRASWDVHVSPVQWNVVLLSGRATVGLLATIPQSATAQPRTTERRC
jgi:dTDP-4-dehydrorhamnose 3,5-epimerase-like enzyme